MLFRSNDTATTEIYTLLYTLSLHDALPISDADAHRELTRLLPLLDAVGVAAWPFVPGTAGRVRALLGRPPTPARWALDPEPPGVPAPPEPPLRR